MNLITGVNGFLGSNLAIHLPGSIGLVRDENKKTKTDWLYDTTLIRGDVLDLELLKRIITENEVTTIYHLASQAIVKYAYQNPKDTFLSNVIGTVNVLEAVRQINPKIKVVCASSDKAYGMQDSLPYRENMDVRASDIYSTSKACGDLVAQSYAMTYGLNVNIIRSANIYGPGDMNFSRLIPGTIRRILKGEAPIIYNNGSDRREYIHASDVCEAYKLVADKSPAGEIYNIGDRTFLDTWEVVEGICKFMDFDYSRVKRVRRDEIREIPFQYLDASKLESLGWSKKIDSTEGLTKTILWYKLLYETRGYL